MRGWEGCWFLVFVFGSGCIDCGIIIILIWFWYDFLIFVVRLRLGFDGIVVVRVVFGSFVVVFISMDFFGVCGVIIRGIVILD